VTKFALLSDSHGHLPVIEEPVDFLIHAGDIAPLSNHHPSFQRDWMESVFYPYLSEIPAKYILWIYGNHDFVGDSSGSYYQHLTFYEKEGKAPPPNVYNITDELIELEGLFFYGYPYVPNLPGWAFNRENSELKELAAQIPPCDILISHGPPQGYGDRMTFSHVGDQNLTDNLERISPQLLVCGHIHEASGISEHPNVEQGIWNVSYLDRNYEPYSRGVIYHEFDLKQKEYSDIPNRDIGR